jgi:hypothetical protein
VWGSPEPNTRGTQVEEFFFQKGLSVLNEGDKPTFETSRAATHIDVTAASPALAMMIQKWQVCDEMHLSDHHLITADLQIGPDQQVIRKGSHLKKADWPKFQSLIDKELKDYEDPLLWSPRQIEKTTSMLHTAITAALDVVAEVKPYKPKKALFSWWRADLDEIRKAARKAHNYARRRPREEERWEAYRALRKKFKNALLKARTESWRSFTAEQVSPKQAA